MLNFVSLLVLSLLRINITTVHCSSYLDSGVLHLGSNCSSHLESVIYHSRQRWYDIAVFVILKSTGIKESRDHQTY